MSDADLGSVKSHEEKMEDLIKGYINSSFKDAKVNTSDSLTKRNSVIEVKRLSYDLFLKYAEDSITSKDSKDPKVQTEDKSIMDFIKSEQFTENSKDIFDVEKYRPIFSELIKDYSSAIDQKRKEAFSDNNHKFIVTPSSGTGFLNRLKNTITMPFKKIRKFVATQVLGYTLKFIKLFKGKSKNKFLLSVEDNIKKHGIFSKEYRSLLDAEKKRLEEELEPFIKKINTRVAGEDMSGVSFDSAGGDKQRKDRKLLECIDKAIETYESQVRAINEASKVSQVSPVPPLVSLDEISLDGDDRFTIEEEIPSSGMTSQKERKNASIASDQHSVDDPKLTDESPDSILPGTTIEDRVQTRRGLATRH